MRFLFALLLSLTNASLPDHALTPGVTRPLTVQALCTTKWGLDRRAVTVKMKRDVARSYDVPWEKRGNYEFDHLIPRELGGADDVRNLWPQPWPQAREKDRLENALRKAVCARRVALSVAQRAIADDWVAAYHTYVVH
jgi:hypothetical protein